AARAGPAAPRRRGRRAAPRQRDVVVAAVRRRDRRVARARVGGACEPLGLPARGGAKALGGRGRPGPRDRRRRRRDAHARVGRADRRDRAREAPPILARAVARAGPRRSATRVSLRRGDSWCAGQRRAIVRPTFGQGVAVSMLEIVKAGGWTMLPILACSVAAVAIILERLWTLQRKRVLPPDLTARVREWVRSGQFDLSHLQALHQSSPLGQVLAAGLARHHAGREVVKESIEDAGRHVVHELERYLNALMTIAGVTPLLGLLGTVSGMIRAFS